MANETNAPENIEIVVVSPKPTLTGLNVTVEALKELEGQVDRLISKMAGVANIPAVKVDWKPIKQEVANLRKAMSIDITPMNLEKQFFGGVQPGDMQSKLRGFKDALQKGMFGTAKDARKMFEKGFESGFSGSKPFVSENMAAKYVAYLRQLNADASRVVGDFIKDSNRSFEAIAARISEQSQSATIKTPAQQVRPERAPVGDVSLTGAQAKKRTTVKRGGKQIDVGFESPTDKLLYLASQAKDIKERAKMLSSLQNQLNVAEVEARENMDAVKRAVMRTEKATRSQAIEKGKPAFVLKRQPLAWTGILPGIDKPSAQPATPAPATVVVSPPEVKPTIQAGTSRIALEIRGDQIVATLLPPPIRLEIPGSSIQATITGPINATVTQGAAASTPATAAGGGGRGGGGTGGRKTPSGEPDDGDGEGSAERTLKPDPKLGPMANEIKRRVVRTEKDVKTTIEQALRSLEKVETTFSEQTAIKEATTTISGLKTPVQQFAQNVKESLKTQRALFSTRSQFLKAGKTPEDLDALASETRSMTERLRKQLRTESARLLRSTTPDTRGVVRKTVIDPHAAEVNRAIESLETKAMIAERRAAELRVRMADAGVKDVSQAQMKEAERHGKNRARVQASRIKADDQRLKDIEAERKLQEKMAEAVRKRQAVELNGLEAEAVIRRSAGEGFRTLPVGKGRSVSSTGKLVDVEEHKFEKIAGDVRTIRRVEIQREVVPPGAPPGTPPGRVVAASFRDTPGKAPASHQGFGEFAFQKFKALGTYAGEAMLLYGALEEVNKALTSMIQTQQDIARLGQVFKGVGGSARELLDDVIELAAVEGRAANDARDSAASWARLGLTRSQVDEAVRVSLQGANVANISAAQSTDHLQTVMAAYGLSIKDLAPTMGAITAVSQQFKVTQDDLFDALSRTASVAKQTGVPFAELIGILGAVIFKSGQTGITVGNMLKTLIGSLAKPEIQEFLRRDFKIEVTRNQGSDLKPMLQVMNELNSAYQKGNKLEQQQFLNKLLGPLQISRLSAFFDSYEQGLIAAANAQGRLNATEKASEAIRATLGSRLTGLRSEMERFFAAFDDSSGLTRSLTELTNGFGNILRAIVSIKNLLPIKATDDSTDMSTAGGKIVALHKLMTDSLIPGKGALTGLSLLNRAFEGVSNISGGVERSIGQIDSRIAESQGQFDRASIVVDRYKLALSDLIHMPTDRAAKRLKDLSGNDLIKDIDKKRFIEDATSAFKNRDQGQLEAAFNPYLAQAQQEKDKAVQAIAELRQNKRAVLDAGMDRLQAKGGKDAATQIEKLQQLASQETSHVTKETQAQAEARQDMMRSYDEQLQSDVEHLGFLARQRSMLETIASTYRQIGSSMPIAQQIQSIQILETQVQALRMATTELERQREAELAVQAAREEGDMNPANTYKFTVKRAAIDKDRIAAEAQLRAARQSMTDSLRETEVGIAVQIASAQPQAFEFGETEIDRLRNREAGIKALMAQNMAVAESQSATELQRELARVQINEQLNQLVTTRLDMERARLNIFQSEFELNRKMLTSGPSELLEYIVANRATSKGPMNAGQFLAFSPSIREKMMETGKVNREREFYNQRQPIDQTVGSIIVPFVQAMEKWALKLSPPKPQTIPSVVQQPKQAQAAPGVPIVAALLPDVVKVEVQNFPKEPVESSATGSVGTPSTTVPPSSGATEWKGGVGYSGAPKEPGLVAEAWRVASTPVVKMLPEKFTKTLYKLPFEGDEKNPMMADVAKMAREMDESLSTPLALLMPGIVKGVSRLVTGVRGAFARPSAVPRSTPPPAPPVIPVETAPVPKPPTRKGGKLGEFFSDIMPGGAARESRFQSKKAEFERATQVQKPTVIPSTPTVPTPQPAPIPSKAPATEAPPVLQQPSVVARPVAPKPQGYESPTSRSYEEWVAEQAKAGRPVQPTPIPPRVETPIRVEGTFTSPAKVQAKASEIIPLDIGDQLLKAVREAGKKLSNVKSGQSATSSFDPSDILEAQKALDSFRASLKDFPSVGVAAAGIGVATVATATANAATESETFDISAKAKAFSDEIDKAIDIFSTRNGLQLAQPKPQLAPQPDGFNVGLVEPNFAKQSLEQFTTFLGVSNSALRSFASGLETVTSSVGKLGTQVDSLTNKFGAMFPDRNAGPPKLPSSY
jgi:TP901 family phage tail tape measure protein